MNAHWQIGLVLGTTFKRGEDTWVSMGGRSCHCGQHSKEGQECPLADRAVVGNKVQKRGGHCPWAGWAATPGNIQRKDMNVHWQKGLSRERESIQQGMLCRFYVEHVPRECAQWLLSCMRVSKLLTIGAPLTRCG
jgi:hypothetical protein